MLFRSGSGAILREALEAATLLEERFEVSADVWSVTSFTELRRDGLDVERHNRMHPEEPARTSYLERQLKSHPGPVVAATDYVKSYADLIRPFVPRRYTTLGTDGFGRSDERTALRSYYEVDRYYIVVAALKSLADEGHIAESVVSDAIQAFNLDPEKADPLTV